MAIDSGAADWRLASLRRPWRNLRRMLACGRENSCDVEEDVWSKQLADHSHRFWHGYENSIASVARGKVKQGGNVIAMLKLLPVVRSAFKMFPIVLEEMVYGDPVINP
jgi:hypothetical protein